jgi:tRNA (guanosine-2'-O-)-methyltransferase
VSPRFPEIGPFPFGKSAQEILEILEPFLTEERQRKIREVVDGRTCNVVPVLENIYDRGNISAVLRSAEALGFQCAHIIEATGDKFKNSARVSQGADKWLDLKTWRSPVEGEATRQCVRELKKQGFQILATHLDERAKPLGEIDVTVPTAIVYGNERDGISKEMIELCDQTVIIPMKGFVQSFNISVAAAISLYHISREREAGGDLSAEEKTILRAEFSLRSSKNPEKLIEEILSRRE